MTLLQPFAVKMLQTIASLLTSTYYSQQRLFNKLLLSLILLDKNKNYLPDRASCTRILFAQRVIFVALGKWASVSVEH